MNAIVFINGSPNKDGNTVKLARSILGDTSYDTVHLVDLKIYSCGQNFADDQYEEVIQTMENHTTIVIGSPVYWHSMTGALRTVLDRAYGFVPNGHFKGKQLIFIFQGAAPTKEQLAAADYTMGRFADIYGFVYKGMVTNKNEAAQMAASL